MKGEGMIFSNVKEILLALGNGSVSLHAKVKARVPTPVIPMVHAF